MQSKFLWLLTLGGCAAGDPGTITAVIDDVTGANTGNMLLITEARDENGNQAAIFCEPITADPFSASQVLEAIVGPTPCEDSEPIELAAGAYSLLTAVMEGGAEGPSQCAESTVDVDGDVTVTMPALGACD